MNGPWLDCSSLVPFLLDFFLKQKYWFGIVFGFLFFVSHVSGPLLSQTAPLYCFLSFSLLFYFFFFLGVIVVEAVLEDRFGALLFFWLRLDVFFRISTAASLQLGLDTSSCWRGLQRVLYFSIFCMLC